MGKACAICLLRSGTLVKIIGRDAKNLQGMAEGLRAAGISSPKPFLEHDRSELDVYHGLNRSTVFIAQAAANNRRRHDGGALVNIGQV